MRSATAVRAAVIGLTLLALAVVLVFLITVVRPAGGGNGGGGDGGGGDGAVAADPESIAAGERLYEANCARCHGADARGGGPDAGTTRVRPPSLVSGHIADHSDEDLVAIITHGLPGGMPAFEDVLSEDERWDVVAYIRSLQEPE